jgi:hypothetical protein
VGKAEKREIINEQCLPQNNNTAKFKTKWAEYNVSLCFSQTELKWRIFVVSSFLLSVVQHRHYYQLCCMSYENWLQKIRPVSPAHRTEPGLSLGDVTLVVLLRAQRILQKLRAFCLWSPYINFGGQFYKQTGQRGYVRSWRSNGQSVNPFAPSDAWKMLSSPDPTGQEAGELVRPPEESPSGNLVHRRKWVEAATFYPWTQTLAEDLMPT